MNSGIAERRKTPFFQTGNELLDVFEPIVGSDCFTIYSLLRAANSETQSWNTPFRSLQALWGSGLLRFRGLSRSWKAWD
jgi:hypothetical protein